MTTLAHADRVLLETMPVAEERRAALEADGAWEHGPVYSRSFCDLDGHGWQVMGMDPVAVRQGHEEVAAPRRRRVLGHG